MVSGEWFIFVFTTHHAPLTFGLFPLAGFEHLDRRAKVAFHFDPGSGQGHVYVYDVTAKATPGPLSDAPAVPLFDFSFDGGGKTNLPPPKFSDPLSLRIDDDVLCILLNIVDRLIERPHPDH